MSERLVRQKNVKLDEVYTPDYALNPLVPFLKSNSTIWDCAYGRGHLAKSLDNRGFKCVGSQETNFFNSNLDCDYIVTNPPYSLKEKFLQRAYQLKKPFAFLLPLTTLEGIKRGKMFKENGVQIIIPNKRINFIVPSGKNSSWFATAWFTWGLNLPKDLMFVELILSISPNPKGLCISLRRFYD